MKKAICMGLVLVLFAGMTAGCAENSDTSANDPTADTVSDTADSVLESTEAPTMASDAAHDFNFAGNGVRVKVDLNGGWSVEFGEMATYLYYGPVDETEKAVAVGVYLSQEEYDEYLAEYDDLPTFEMGENGSFVYKAEDVHYYVSKVTEGVYFNVMLPPSDTSGEISKRFSVTYTGAAFDGQDSNNTGDGQSAVATHIFHYIDTDVKVTIDLLPGWTADFGENATYLYDAPDADEAVAWGTYMTRDEYKEFVSDYSDEDSFVKNGGDIRYTDEESDIVDYIITIQKGLYYRVSVNKAEDPDAVRNCFQVELDEYGFDVSDEDEDSDDTDDTDSDDTDDTDFNDTDDTDSDDTDDTDSDDTDDTDSDDTDDTDSDDTDDMDSDIRNRDDGLDDMDANDEDDA